MPFRVRTATASRWWSLHTVFNTHCLCRNLYYSALSKPQFSGNCDDFLQWLERKAACSISSSLFIGNSSYGRSLFASKIIQTGDCILKVPYRVQITADNLLPEIRSLIGEEVGNIAKLATVILIEKKLGQGSEWYPYISCLPQQGELHNTIFECSHQSFGDSTYKDFMHACTLVGSRAWGSTNGLALIPFADFLNHDGVSEAIVMSDDDKQCSEIIADRDYAPGEQVLIRYGKFSNATLMLDFGFTIPYNIYDQVQIQFDIPKHDPLRDMKLELLHQYFIPPPEDMKGLSHPVNSFSIKEVKSDSGKGKGLPQSLRALARVLSCTTSQEIDNLIAEAAQTDGRLARRPLQDISKEIQAHMMLLSLFIQLIEERSVAIMSLDSPSLCGRFSVRKLMAQDLLQGELRILKSASAWLENYCLSMT
ncbi:uncharacterized protein LOC114372218 isoform X5 [Glycine soja]|uniref:uncharacterized protein LOC114372218 isoform X5 n=1 Tax=Glycine soja TaxID=3848 RepID=UPI00103E5C80|nr:uncharacterized protein LOC114372218 isoform X5 [Glycine soja]